MSEEKKKGGFKKFCSFIFALIFIAALGGCGYFAYLHYFKKDAYAEIKELVYTVGYDLGIIDELDFKVEIGTSPIKKPLNIESGMFSGELSTSEEWVDYSSTNDIYVGTGDAGYDVRAFISDTVVYSFFKSNVKENVHYKLADDTYAFFTIKGDTVVFSKYHNNYYYETEYTLIDKNDDGITEYSVVYKNGALGACAIEVGMHYNSKVVKVLMDGFYGAGDYKGGELALVYAFDVINEKAMYAESESIRDKLLAYINTYHRSNPEQDFADIEKVDWPTA
ncbi:MAG: hypothetical protein E7379_03855 [Clostridiales bacterium]|nr:hypothetical protein [Clostridiales bacterium]